MKYVQCIQEWKPTRIFNHLPNSRVKEPHFEKNCLLQGRVCARWAAVEEVSHLHQLLTSERNVGKISLLKEPLFFPPWLRQRPHLWQTCGEESSIWISRNSPLPNHSLIRVLLQSKKWASLFFISHFVMYNNDYIKYLMSELLASGRFVYSRNVRLFKLP